MQRRLAAIMVADVVGSSRLIEVDEAAALSAMRQRWSEIVEPLVKEHSGPHEQAVARVGGSNP